MSEWVDQIKALQDEFGDAIETEIFRTVDGPHFREGDPVGEGVWFEVRDYPGDYEERLGNLRAKLPHLTIATTPWPKSGRYPKFTEHMRGKLTGAIRDF